MALALYTAAEVARVVGISAGRLAYWARTGLVTPSVKQGGRGLFCFEDLVAVKAAAELTARGVSLQAVRRNLRALRGALPPPDEAMAPDPGAPGAPTSASSAPRAAAPPPPPPRARPLSRLRVVSDGEQLVVVEDDVAIEPLSGQVVMDFMVAALSARATEVLALPPPARERGAWEWFREAVALDERGLPDRAEQALRRALEVDPALAAAHNNLGLLAQRRGERGEARQHYELALALDPEQPEARYNLANLSAEQGELDAALAGWSQVIAGWPDFADAHYNLGASLAGAARSTVDGARARFHLLRYLELDPAGAWADAARGLVTDCAPAG